MDIQMTIPVPSGDALIKGRITPIVISRTNITPLSHAAIRDSHLLNDLQTITSFSIPNFRETFATDSLLYLLLVAQKVCGFRGAADIRLKTAIKALETAWIRDIQSWSEDENMSCEDAVTGEIIWNTHLARFIHLILKSLQTRKAFIHFDKMGDISRETDTAGTWRECCFHSYSFNGWNKTLEMQFTVDNQIKGVILPINDIKNFNKSGICFQHPIHPDCVLFNPFSCKEFVEPSYGSDKFRKQVFFAALETYTLSTRNESGFDHAMVRLQ